MGYLGLRLALPFDGVEQTALLNDVLNKGREGLRLVGPAGGDIGNHAGIKVHVHLVACLNVPGRFVAFQNCQTDVDGVAVENAGKGGGDHAGDTRGLDGDGRVFSGRAAAKVLFRYHDVPWLYLIHKIQIGRAHV